MNNIPQMLLNSTVAPYNIALNYTSIYGDTSALFSDIEYEVNFKVAQGIVLGARIGCSALMMIVLWISSRNRRTPIFIINQISLLCVFLHSACYIAHLKSGLSSLTFQFTMFPQIVTISDKQLFAAVSALQVLSVTAIQVSMVFQIKAIFTGTNYHHSGTAATIIGIGMGISTITVYMIAVVQSINTVYNHILSESPTRFYNIASIMLASSVNYVSIVLILKLVYAIRMRWYLGLRQFDSFHILLIMSTQTLIVPSVIFILAYAIQEDENLAVLQSVGILVFVMSLPLSSMWAASTNNDPAPYIPSTITFDARSLETSKSIQSVTRKRMYNIYGQRPGTSTMADTSGKADLDIADLETPTTAADNTARKYWTYDEKLQ